MISSQQRLRAREERNMRQITAAACVLSLAFLASLPATAAKPPEDGTYFVVAMGLADEFAVQAECFAFTAAGLCSLDGEICGSWQPLETAGSMTSFEFELFALDGASPVTLEGVGRVDTRGKKSAIGGAGRVTGLGAPANFAFSGRETHVSKCLRLLAAFVGDDGDAVTGSGTLATETRDVSSFSGVVLGGVGKLIIAHGETESLSITAEENILPLLRSEVSGGRLILGPPPGSSISNTRDIVYRLTVRELDSLVVSGVTVVRVEGVDTDLLTVNLTGTSVIRAFGRADRQEIVVSGLGDYRARNLESRVATVDVSGLGSAVLRVDQRLRGTVGDFGVVEYIGNPTVDVSVSDFGQVRKVGN
jgi:hypothetical protein